MDVGWCRFIRSDLDKMFPFINVTYIGCYHEYTARYLTFISSDNGNKIMYMYEISWEKRSEILFSPKHLSRSKLSAESYLRSYRSLTKSTPQKVVETKIIYTQVSTYLIYSLRYAGYSVLQRTFATLNRFWLQYSLFARVEHA